MEKKERKKKKKKDIMHGYFLPVCVKDPELKGRRNLCVKIVFTDK